MKEVMNMKQLHKIFLFISFMAFMFLSLLWSGTTGKISGIIIDEDTRDPLAGANVVILGTSLGAAADLEGQYTILYVPPGMYDVQVSFIGYATVTVKDVRVNIDQTSHVNFSLESEAIELETVTIVADKLDIRPDVATSVVSLSDKEVEELPVSSVVNVIGMQAGVSGGLAGDPNYAVQPLFISTNYSRGKVSVQGGLNIRGGEGDNILFMLDGVTLRDPRNNEPITKVALSAVKEISVERGGFNAEYGQVSSGLVNIVTKEGSSQGYFGSIQTRISPPAPKYWRGKGILDIHDLYSFALRPYYDPAVCWEGTENGAWDKYTRNQYFQFDGWNKISETLCNDSDPTNDLTPLGAQRIFMFETRKEQPNDQPDYEIDAGFGGPVPFIGEQLGDLRFFGSYRRNREMLLFPLSRPDYVDYDWSMRLISNITPSMKLQISGILGKQFTMRHNWDATGTYYYPRYPNQIADVASSSLFFLFSDFNFSLADIGHRSLSAKLTQTISPKAFYEVSVENFRRDYKVGPAALRDTSQKYEILRGYYHDSGPFGYWPYESGDEIIMTGAAIQHIAKARDSTVVNSTTLKLDFTSQVDFNNLVKTGFEFIYNDLDFDYGTISSGSAGKTYANRVQMHVFPVRAALYLQDKMETKEFTMTAGLRLDYSNSKVDWYSVDPYNRSLFSSNYDESMVFVKKKSKDQWQLSPRLGISHPITKNSKLFFNYGHFRQVPQYESLFRIQRSETGSMTSFGDPDVMLAKTISYELGYDHRLFNDYLIQLAAFYKDILDQQDFTQYNSIYGFSYSKTTSNHYEDIRGFELTLRKTRGRWMSGFANYTYQVTTTGHFGAGQMYDDPLEQKKYNEATVNLYQDRPIPTPNARINITMYTPEDLGPKFLGHNILGGFSLNCLLNWQAGYWTTWSPNDATMAYNVQARDFLNITMRLIKNINFSRFRIQMFVDVHNVLNTLRLWNTRDTDYMNSLHLTKSKAYDNIPGNDKVGDYREPGVEYQPMIYYGDIVTPEDVELAAEQDISINATAPPEDYRAIYYESTSGQYWQVLENNPDDPSDDQWALVDQARINRIKKDKAYIDMPNASTFWFLNPRQVFFGLRISFDLTD
jgi:outer membrane receptor protein involved in Fe transport